MRTTSFKRHEFRCKAIAAGGTSPLAELAIEDAASLLQFCTDLSPFLNLLDDKTVLSPQNRDTLRASISDWQLQRGQYAEAIKISEALKYVDKWTLIGPFDNRDKAGFVQVQEPEKEINFEKSCEGRNRRVAWTPLATRAYDGRVIPAEIYEPHIHVLAFAATLVKSETETNAVLRAGCGGALAVWVNGILAGKVPEYNDFGRDKLTAPIALRKGWNLILVKSAVVEETQWAFLSGSVTLRAVHLQASLSTTRRKRWPNGKKRNPSHPRPTASDPIWTWVWSMR